MIPFSARFEGESEDKRLAQELAKELPGILTWAISGARTRYSDGTRVWLSVKTTSERSGF